MGWWHRWPYILSVFLGLILDNIAITVPNFFLLYHYFLILLHIFYYISNYFGNLASHLILLQIDYIFLYFYHVSIGVLSDVRIHCFVAVSVYWFLVIVFMEIAGLVLVYVWLVCDDAAVFETAVDAFHVRTLLHALLDFFTVVLELCELGAIYVHLGWREVLVVVLKVLDQGASLVIGVISLWRFRYRF